jgi:outer membrane immunogenic protein
MAADMPVKARPLPPPPAPTWTGFYVGLNAGYAWDNSDPITLGGINALIPSSAPSLRPKGFIGGGQAGYNRQIGQWLIGGEIDFSGLDAKADASLSPFFTNKSANTLTWSSRYDWLFTARLRGGFLVAPNWLLYATGGLAVTHVNDSAVCTTPSNSCTTSSLVRMVTWSESNTLTGGTVGGGIETMFGPNWTARVEYLYAKFKDTTPPSVTVAVPPIPALFRFRHDLNVVRFAINYKFGS